MVGDRVNTAARDSGGGRARKVLVDDVTRQVSSAAIAYEDAGEHVLKGKGEPVRLSHPARVVSGVGGKRREASLEAPLVGRDTDLRLIKDLFHSGIEHGVARLVAVSGPAGVGKTRLRWEFDKYIDGLADDFLFHSGTLPALRRRGRVLGTRGDGAPAARDPGGVGHRGRDLEARRGPRPLDRRAPPIANSWSRGSGRCSASPSPAWHAGSCSRAGGCSSSASPSTSRW